MSRHGLLLFASISLVCGVPYFLIKVAGASVSPSVLSFVRVAVAAIVLAPIAHRRGAWACLHGRWSRIAVFAAVQVAMPFTLIPFGERTIPSSLAGMLIAAEPMFIAVLAPWLDRAERVNAVRGAGLVAGGVGLVLMLGLDVGQSAQQLVGAAAVVAAALCYAIALLLTKRWFGDGPPIPVISGTLAVATVMLLPTAAATAPPAWPSLRAIAALSVLGLCTATGFVLWFALVAELGASRAAVTTYTAPIVSLALGASLLDESFSLVTVAGVLLIVAGSWVSAGGRRPRREAARVIRRRTTAARRPA
jgi:drug/metabolite transporter (DMT)-like permease